MKEKSNSYNLIAISGCKNSGKDCITTMLQYCLSVPKIFRQYWIYEKFRKWVKPKYRRLAFADPMKRMLSILLNVPYYKFNNRNFKEDCVINVPTLDYSLSTFNNESERMSDSKFNKLVKSLDPSLAQSNLTVRQLMQYFATNVMQTYFGRNVWINSTLKHCNKPTIISDLRFKAEFDAVKSKDGLFIYVNRPGCEFGEHASEREMEELLNSEAYDIVIDNNGTKEDLFNKIKSISDVIHNNSNNAGSKTMDCPRRI